MSFRVFSFICRNSRNDIPPKTMLQPVENLFAPITHNLRQPHAAVHCHEQCPLPQANRLGMRNDVWVNQAVPDLHDFHLGSPIVDAQLFQHSGYQGTGGFRPVRARNFLGRKIGAAPRCQHPLPRRAFRWAEGWDAFGWKHHFGNKVSNFSRASKRANSKVSVRLSLRQAFQNAAWATFQSPVGVQRQDMQSVQAGC